LNPERIADPQNFFNIPCQSAGSEISRERNVDLICPLCGAIAVQEKCKLICHSEICRGRVLMNCSEF
jgi:predicted RNA-binding Zn-ribbon protein involved in translation (DUF1610 family)